jgi:hypothetical protein
MSQVGTLRSGDGVLIATNVPRVVVAHVIVDDVSVA